jgi:hypothetical protein
MNHHASFIQILSQFVKPPSDTLLPNVTKFPAVVLCTIKSRIHKVKCHKKKNTIDWLNIYFSRLCHHQVAEESILSPDDGIICRNIY